MLLISANEVGKRGAQHLRVIEATRAANVGLLAHTSLLRADRSTLILAEEHRTGSSDERPSDALRAEYNAQQRSIDGDVAASRVLDVPEISKAVHEKVDPSASRADHLCQHLLRHFRDLAGFRSLFSVRREKQQSPCKPLFTVVEELIDQVSLDAKIPLQDVRKEAVGESG